MILAEYETLCANTLSHVARSLYLLYFKSKRSYEIIVNFMEISYFLDNKSSTYPQQFNANDINKILLELEAHNLIKRVRQDLPFNGNSIFLPFVEAQIKTLPNAPFKMHLSWRPGPNFAQNALISGLKDFSYDNNELKSFINYWEQKGEMRNQNAWERAFILRLIKKKQAKVINNKIDTNYHMKAQTKSIVAEGYKGF